MGAKSPSKTHRISSIYHHRLRPLPPSISFTSFSLVLSHGSDIEAVALSPALPFPRLAKGTGASR